MMSSAVPSPGHHAANPSGSSTVHSDSTRTSTRLLDCASLLSAVNCNTYIPSAPNVAVVTGEVGLPNVTGPGPLTTLHCWLSVPPGGNAGSLTCPFNVAVTGAPPKNRSGPADTIGGAFVSSGHLPTLPEA